MTRDELRAVRERAKAYANIFVVPSEPARDRMGLLTHIDELEVVLRELKERGEYFDEFGNLGNTDLDDLLPILHARITTLLGDEG